MGNEQYSLIPSAEFEYQFTINLKENTLIFNIESKDKSWQKDTRSLMLTNGAPESV